MSHDDSTCGLSGSSAFIPQDRRISQFKKYRYDRPLSTLKSSASALDRLLWHKDRLFWPKDRLLSFLKIVRFDKRSTTFARIVCFRPYWKMTHYVMTCDVIGHLRTFQLKEWDPNYMSAKFNGHNITMSDLMSDSKNQNFKNSPRNPKMPLRILPLRTNTQGRSKSRCVHGSLKPKMCPWIPETKF